MPADIMFNHNDEKSFVLNSFAIGTLTLASCLLIPPNFYIRTNLSRQIILTGALALAVGWLLLTVTLLLHEHELLFMRVKFFLVGLFNSCMDSLYSWVANLY